MTGRVKRNEEDVVRKKKEEDTNKERSGGFGSNKMDNGPIPSLFYNVTRLNSQKGAIRS